MKQLITVVITIAIVFVLLYRFSNHFRTVHNGNRQPREKDRGSNASMDFPVAASRVIIRHLLY